MLGAPAFATKGSSETHDPPTNCCTTVGVDLQVREIVSIAKLPFGEPGAAGKYSEVQVLDGTQLGAAGGM